MKVDKKQIEAYQATANQAFEAAKVAGTYALTEHGGYQAALATNEVASLAWDKLRGLCQGYLTPMIKDKSTDQTWFDYLVPKRDLAMAKVKSLGETRGYLLKDLAEHVQIKPGAAKTERARVSLYRSVQAAASNGSVPVAAAKAADQASPEITAAQPVPVPRSGLWAMLAAGGAAVVGVIWWMGRR